MCKVQWDLVAPGRKPDVGLQTGPQGTQTRSKCGVPSQSGATAPDTPSPPPPALSAFPASHPYRTHTASHLTSPGEGGGRRLLAQIQGQ